MTQTTPEQRQELLRLAAGAHRATTAGRTIQDMADAIHFQETCVNAVPALLADLDAAEAEIERLMALVRESYREGFYSGNAAWGVANVERREEKEWIQSEAKGKTQ